ncbi:hypothetical protein PsYK624_105750 [Phanerochaete sordida]|uniref:Uncharacterized protein n=1 Tax=Phanerochaete sordida TaxID=48140 RepID=A0A9P3LGB9_9APHY|nr:hypothetical protein PsYK624_105750 [Phanerochaete sordida]
MVAPDEHRRLPLTTQPSPTSMAFRSTRARRTYHRVNGPSWSSGGDLISKHPPIVSDHHHFEPTKQAG